MPPLRPADDGLTQPTSPYDYHDMSLQDLRNVLSLSPTGIKTVQDAWQQLSANMTNVLTGPAVSLEQALTLLKGWDSKLASKPFKDRAGQILDFGKQIASAAHQASEGFNDLSRTFHTSALFLAMSIEDMNSVHALAESALQEWSRDLYVLVETLSGQTYGAPGFNSSDTIGGFNGYASWQGVPNSPEINFQYLYGQGQKGSYPGVVQFSGQVRPQYSLARVDITAQAGPYGPKTLTNVIMHDDWSDAGWAGRTFPDTHRDQLANLLNQVAGSSYTPVVGQFPQLPQATWLTDGQGNGGSGNGSGNGGPGGVPGYTGGAAGSSITSLVFNPQGTAATAGNVSDGVNAFGAFSGTPAKAIYNETSTPGLVFSNAAGSYVVSTASTIPAANAVATFSNVGGTASQLFTMTLTFPSGAFTAGNVLRYTVNRLELKGSSGSAKADYWADLFGGGVLIPDGTVVTDGMTYSGTTSDGGTFSGTIKNRIGAGYSPLDGYGFINAQTAVSQTVQ